MVFREAVWAHYKKHGRQLPWRESEQDGTFDPYKIMVSEVMLQQTQVPRVIPKYVSFLKRFPDAQSLAHATLSDVLREWSGLGYNRRAKFLHEAARRINYSGAPQSPEAFSQLQGIGFNTAAAICVYAYNQAHAFIETNIRTVFIHHFFPHESVVDDKKILRLVEETLDSENSREWYWALMDYGSYLKQTVGNASRKSKHYVKQTNFKGSRRELRAKVLRELLNGVRSEKELSKILDDERLPEVLTLLAKEGLITQKNNYYQIA